MYLFINIAFFTFCAEISTILSTVIDAVTRYFKLHIISSDWFYAITCK